MARWKSSTHGNGASLDLSNGLRAVVYWEAVERLPYAAPHYNVVVFGILLQGRSATIEDAKARAENVMRDAFARALKALDQ